MDVVEFAKFMPKLIVASHGAAAASAEERGCAKIYGSQ
jgi:hypothetical protein